MQSALGAQSVPEERRLVTARALTVSVALALSAVPSGLLLWFMQRYTGDVPIDDQWLLLPQVVAFGEGNALLFDLFMPYSNHITGAYRLLYAGLIRLPGYSPELDVRLTWLVLTVAMVAFWTAARQALRSPALAALARVPIAGLWFNLRNVEVALSPVNFPTAVAIAFAVGALVLLARGIRSSRAVVGAVLLGVLASWSWGSGIVVWPAGLAQLVWMCMFLQVRPSWRRIAAWAVIGAGMIWLHVFLVTRFPNDLSGVPSPALDLLAAADFFVVLFGSGFSPTLEVARGVGAVVLFVHVLIMTLLLQHASRDRLGAISPLVGLLAFTLKACVMIAVARSAPDDLGRSLAPRYILVAAPGMIALVVLAFRIGEDGDQWRWGLVAVLMTLLGAGLLASYDAGLRFGPVWKRAADARSYLMQTHRDQDDDMLRWLAPDPATVRLAIGMVEPLDWRAFRTRSSDLTGVRGAVKLGSLKVE